MPKKPGNIKKATLAKRLGVTSAAVTKAIREGRIDEEPDGSIDYEKARRQWVKNTNPRKDGGHQPQASTGPSLAAANAAVRAFDAQIKRLRLQQMAGTLVNRERANRLVFAFARQIRDAWISWPARIAPRITADLLSHIREGGELSQRHINILLDKYVHEHLTELAESSAPNI